MKIAIDARIVMRSHARRMVLGVAECAGTAIVLPETAAIMAKLNYHRVAAPSVEKAVVWNAAANDQDLDDEALGIRIQDRLEKATEGFAHWIDDEQKRNDGMFERAPRTRKTQGLAREISLRGVVDDPADTRWGAGEDPYMIAEALEAGAYGIASGDFGTLHPAAMEQWLNSVQIQGRYTHVPRPFVLSSQEALDTMLAQTREPALPGTTAHCAGTCAQRTER